MYLDTVIRTPFHEKQKEFLLHTEGPHQMSGIPKVGMPLLCHYIPTVSAKMTSAVFKRCHLEMQVYSSVGEHLPNMHRIWIASSARGAEHIEE